MLTKFSLRNFSTINTNIKNFNEIYVELRSDVKTLPTKKMRESINDAIFGDDGFEEDPTVNKLCKKISDLFGKQRAILVPSGFMGNSLSLALSSWRDDYILQGERSHLRKLESGSQQLLGFIPFSLKEIDDIPEHFDLEKFVSNSEPLINLSEFSKRTHIIAFENTHNYNGGKIQDTEKLKSNVIPSIQKSKYFKNLRFHLDGSRVLTAAASLKIDPKILVSPFNTVNFCLSKGLGAPCGSVVLMDESDYPRAREIRKNLGGSMRQAGFLAAPALLCLQDWRERFENDCENAKFFASELNKIKGLKVARPDSNIVNIYLQEDFVKNSKMIEIVKYLENHYKVLVMNFDNNNYIRAVLHYQVTKNQLIHAIESFDKTLRNFYH